MLLMRVPPGPTHVPTGSMSGESERMAILDRASKLVEKRIFIRLMELLPEAEVEKANALADVNIHNRFMGFLSIILFISALGASLPAL